MAKKRKGKRVPLSEIIGRMREAGRDSDEDAVMEMLGLLVETIESRTVRHIYYQCHERGVLLACDGCDKCMSVTPIGFEDTEKGRELWRTVLASAKEDFDLAHRECVT